MGADVLSQVERRWPKHHHELGPCLVWTGVQVQGRPYGRMYDPSLKSSGPSHLVVWRRVYPAKPIRKGWTVDHLCGVTLCQRPDHLELVTRAENTRRWHQRARMAAAPAETPKAAPCFAVALFAGIDRPLVQAKTLTLDELVAMLTRFEVLGDKHRGRCWSPTRYADSATSRSNAGVTSVSCLVFDLDRVPPDPHRLEHVCRIGHTTWSHRPESPRWRVAIPIAQPVLSTSWADVWQRARAALCPEADPVCKDPSRAYWLPSHPAEVAPESRYHPGPQLDPRTLPELPPDQRPELRRSPSTRRSHPAHATDRHRGEAYMASVIASLEGVAPGGRNDALNRAAWTLGRWIGSGALEQSDVEDALYAVATRNGLVADDGARQCGQPSGVA
jgi:hypothetical protein